MTTPVPWWRGDPLVAELATQLDAVPAVDVHTHLLAPGSFQPERDPGLPLRLRSTEPSYAAALTERFGVAVEAGRIAPAAREAERLRAAMIERLGEHGYWMDHLDFTGIEVAVVNQELPDGTDGARLRWVPHGSDLLYPLPAEALMARSPFHEANMLDIRARLPRWLADVGLSAAGPTEPPPDLDGYLAFVEQILVRWRAAGAVGIKFWDAYLRSLRFDDTPREEAARLYRTGLTTPLDRPAYLALQDYLARQIFLVAGRHDLTVHIHSSHGVPPYLRLGDSDVRNLESVLTDIRFFDTDFVLIHGGAPRFEDAAYLALKPHVWIDVSAMPFLYSVPELAQVLRIYLRFAPEKTLFGTDVSAYPGVPVGPEIQHVALTRHTREALYLALAGMVRDGLVDAEWAVSIGRGVLRENARRLFGWVTTAR